MSQVDWSQAPKSATHFVMSNEGGIPGGWYMADGIKMRDIANNGEYTFRLDDLHEQRMIHLIARPAQWTGEGLPPVGTVCEFNDGTGGEWKKVEIMYLSKYTILVKFDGSPNEDVEGAYSPEESTYFRPICTPEQTAAEKEYEDILEMLHAEPTMTVRMAKNLHKAGYRKQVAP